MTPGGWQGTLLQVSDPHFGTERPQAVQALLALAREHRPQVLVLSGDLTQRARRAQFDAARRFVDELAVPRVMAVPGNHDIPLFNLPARLLAPYAGWREAFGSEADATLVTDELLLIGLNTTRWWRHKQGQVSRRQIARVSQMLAQAHPQQLRVIVTHQPVHVIRPYDEVNLLRGHAQAVRAWAEAGADLVLGGHIHLAHVRHVSGSLWSVQAGTAVSRRVRHGRPNSVNLIRWRGRQCAVERWDLDDRQGFVCAETVAIPGSPQAQAPA